MGRPPPRGSAAGPDDDREAHHRRHAGQHGSHVLTPARSKITVRVVADDRLPGNGQKQPVACVCAVCGTTKNATVPPACHGIPMDQAQDRAGPM
jgi:hypothetical protein